MYPKLEELDVSHAQAFLAAMEDYAANDPETFSHLYKRSKGWSLKEFKEFLKSCEKQRLDWRPGPNRVSLTHYVLVDGENNICGFGRMRFPLTDQGIKSGQGNLEFDVPPQKRRQGYGTLTLNRMLFEAVRAGLARVLVVCPQDHTIAQKIIMRNRGHLDSKDSGFAKFWINFRP